MARNKYPEETEKKILDAAAHLFVTKGFEATSLQDIMNATGVSKGAIYHHFSSKEDIFDKVTDMMTEGLLYSLLSLVNDPNMTGHEKIKEIIRISVTSSEQEKSIGLAPNVLDNPKFLVIMIRGIFEFNVPYVLEPIIRQGIEDGSIVAQHPKQIGEALLILSNLWIAPIVYGDVQEEMEKRLDVADMMFKAVGMNLFDDEMRQACLKLIKKLSK